MRIGLSSIVGDGFGTGSFQISEIAGEISFPEAGTILETLTLQTYPIAEGGASVTINSNNYPSQTASVYRKADGSGGNYLDWASAFNIAYIVYANYIANNPNQVAYIEVPSGGGSSFDGGTYTIEYYHDGYGSFYQSGTSYSYYNDGTNTNLSSLNVSLQTEVPNSSGNFYQNGKETAYTWNGSGGYNYPVTIGNYYYYGIYIYNDGTSAYYWDGNGGYYAV